MILKQTYTLSKSILMAVISIVSHGLAIELDPYLTPSWLFSSCRGESSEESKVSRCSILFWPFTKFEPMEFATITSWLHHILLSYVICQLRKEVMPPGKQPPRRLQIFPLLYVWFINDSTGRFVTRLLRVFNVCSRRDLSETSKGT